VRSNAAHTCPSALGGRKDDSVQWWCRVSKTFDPAAHNDIYVSATTVNAVSLIYCIYQFNRQWCILEP
jgi:hypothetical protein